MNKKILTLAVSIAAGMSPVAAHAVATQTIIGFDFNNVTTGQTTTTASYQGPATTNGAWNTGGLTILPNGSANPFGVGFEPNLYIPGTTNLSVTRFFGLTQPSMTFTTAVDYPTSRLSFSAVSNHNYPADQSYKVQVYVDGNPAPLGTITQTVGSPFAAFTVRLPYLTAGDHVVTWQLKQPKGGLDTSSDFFALAYVFLTTP